MKKTIFRHQHDVVHSLVLVLLVLLLASSNILSGCDSSAATTGIPAESTTASATPSPTPEMTTTVQPTSTPQPTLEPSPTPLPQPVNPMTGEPLVRAEAEGQRPVAIMINNHRSAVPQIGIGSADILCEMLVEGGITRMLAVFADVVAIPEIGSVRSGRHDYIDLAGGLDAIYVHIGASYLANEQFSRQGTAHIDLHNYSSAYWRDPDWSKNRGYEHSVKTTGELLQAAIAKAGYRMTVREGQKTAFNFRPYGSELTPAKGDPALKVTIPYSDYCTATFTYSETTSLYQKGQFGKDQIDLATGQPLQFTNLFILMTRVVVVDAGILKDAALEAGSGFYVSGGQWQAITWKKGKTNDSFIFMDQDGNELLVNPGKSYLGIVPDSKDIKFR